jgi:hypothetical protein
MKYQAAIIQLRVCTKIWHAPVDELHSIENKANTFMKIPLTSSLAGVKTQSFFDKFQALRLAVCHFAMRASALRRPRQLVAEAPVNAGLALCRTGDRRHHKN